MSKENRNELVSIVCNPNIDIGRSIKKTLYRENWRQIFLFQFYFFQTKLYFNSHIISNKKNEENWYKITHKLNFNNILQFKMWNSRYSNKAGFILLFFFFNIAVFLLKLRVYLRTIDFLRPTRQTSNITECSILVSITYF